jgi:undecaprenyl-diphosphatase
VIERLLDGLAGLPPGWFLALAFFLPFAECVALLDAVVPGEVGMVFIGAAARDADVNLVAVIALGTLGATLGDTTSWYVGRRWGTSLLTRWESVRRRTEGPLAQAQSHFAQHGGSTIFAARFVGALRALVPLVAGASGMTLASFLPWNLAASIMWVSTLVILGAVFGDAVASTVDRIGSGLSVILVLAVVAAVVVVRSRRKRRQA